MEKAVEKNYQFIIPLTDEQKRSYDNKRKKDGKTSQGCLKTLVLHYIGEDSHDQHTDC